MLTESLKSLWRAARNVSIALLVLTLVAGLFGAIWWLACSKFVENYQWGYKFNAWTGEITVLPHSGYFVGVPFFVQIHTVDTRPIQVNISANQRVLNAKLVQFNKDEKALRLFLQWHGCRDYEGGHHEEGSFEDILKAYAYDGQGNDYPFLTVLRDMRTESVGASSVVTK